MLRDVDRVPELGFIRVRIFSRFRNATKHQLWISYQPTDEICEERIPIRGHFCTCKSGARTLGTCAHITSVLWYLGYARLEENIRYPSNMLLESIRDAGNRHPPENVDP